jgi:hypothetical protein
MARGFWRAMIAAIGLCAASVGSSLQAQDYFGYYAFPAPSKPCYTGTSSYVAEFGDDCNGFSASMYPSPRPVPMFVGHTYVNYAPLQPHHFLYSHKHSGIGFNPHGFSTYHVRYW